MNDPVPDNLADKISPMPNDDTNEPFNDMALDSTTAEPHRLDTVNFDEAASQPTTLSISALDGAVDTAHRIGALLMSANQLQQTSGVASSEASPVTTVMAANQPSHGTPPPAAVTVISHQQPPHIPVVALASPLNEQQLKSRLNPRTAAMLDQAIQQQRQSSMPPTPPTESVHTIPIPSGRSQPVNTDFVTPLLEQQQQPRKNGHLPHTSPHERVTSQTPSISPPPLFLPPRLPLPPPRQSLQGGGMGDEIFDSSDYATASSLSSSAVAYHPPSRNPPVDMLYSARRHRDMDDHYDEGNNSSSRRKHQRRYRTDKYRSTTDDDEEDRTSWKAEFEQLFSSKTSAANPSVGGGNNRQEVLSQPGQDTPASRKRIISTDTWLHHHPDAFDEYGGHGERIVPYDDSSNRRKSNRHMVDGSATNSRDFVGNLFATATSTPGDVYSTSTASATPNLFGTIGVLDNGRDHEYNGVSWVAHGAQAAQQYVDEYGGGGIGANVASHLLGKAAQHASDTPIIRRNKCWWWTRWILIILAIVLGIYCLIWAAQWIFAGLCFCSSLFGSTALCFPQFMQGGQLLYAQQQQQQQYHTTTPTSQTTPSVVVTTETTSWYRRWAPTWLGGASGSNTLPNTASNPPQTHHHHTSASNTASSPPPVMGECPIIIHTNDNVGQYMQSLVEKYRLGLIGPNAMVDPDSPNAMCFNMLYGEQRHRQMLEYMAVLLAYDTCAFHSWDELYAKAMQNLNIFGPESTHVILETMHDQYFAHST